MINWLRTTKIIFLKKSNKKKYLTVNPNNKSEYTILDEELPIISKARVRTMHHIPKKEKRGIMINPLISTYFTIRRKQQIEEYTEYSVLLLQNTTINLHRNEILYHLLISLQLYAKLQCTNIYHALLVCMQISQYFQKLFFLKIIRPYAPLQDRDLFSISFLTVIF